MVVLVAALYFRDFAFARKDRGWVTSEDRTQGEMESRWTVIQENCWLGSG
jgi:hypothetical protein